MTDTRVTFWPCASCDALVDLSRNHATDPIRHVYCAIAELRAPEPTPDLDDEWLRAFKARGSAYMVSGPGTGVAGLTMSSCTHGYATSFREVAAYTAEWNSRGTDWKAGWDIPADLRDDPSQGPRLSWVIIGQTPCPGGESVPYGTEVPWEKTFICQDKHHHPRDGSENAR